MPLFYAQESGERVYADSSCAYVIAGLDNLPTEIQFLLAEIKHKETRSQGKYRALVRFSLTSHIHAPFWFHDDRTAAGHPARDGQVHPALPAQRRGARELEGRADAAEDRGGLRGGRPARGREAAARAAHGCAHRAGAGAPRPRPEQGAHPAGRPRPEPAEHVRHDGAQPRAADQREPPPRDDARGRAARGPGRADACAAHETCVFSLCCLSPPARCRADVWSGWVGADAVARR